ncbi:ATP-binding protein [Nocardioides coralli]|uniref:ATP-binding protein n=1 Tax=Nocardioides coralli TaxID=2872154 RepID=UPI001CA408E7|nr:ATP-binding protein [Nocardioides coralli]QZY28836.1 ATP-binding protein [Nocardioides coralli]
MPLSRPALAVGTGPRSVHAARRWVVEVLADIGRPELSEPAELAVSELVTNAVLHAEPPISVLVRGTRGHPRIEVRDGSTEPPVLPQPSELDPLADVDEADLMVTFGRGLDIVARSSDAWGAEIEETGKVVWFTPALTTREHGTLGTISGLTELLERSPSPDNIPFHLLGAPVRHLADFERHYRELRREVRLLALAHDDEYPLAKNLSALFGSMQRELREGLDSDDVRRAREAGEATTDLTVRLSRESAETMGRFVELLDFADEFCRQERMLALARSPEQRSFQTWFLTEFIRQQAGQSPLPFAREQPQRVRA